MEFHGEDLVDMAARRTLADWIWGGLGLTTAAASAGFATYMAIVGPAGFGHPSPAEFGTFASLVKTPPIESKAMQPLHGPSSNPRMGNETSSSAAAAPSGPIDFAPTGTVADAPDEHKVDPTEKPHVSNGAASLPGYVLRDVFDGKALIESRSALALVAPGSTLDGAGQVESIERQGDAWVVKTTTGIITTTAH